MLRRQFLVDKVPYFIYKFDNKKVAINILNENEYIEQIDDTSLFYKVDENKILGCKLSKYKKQKLLKNTEQIYKTRYYIPLTSCLYALIDFDNGIPSDIYVDFNSENDFDNFIIPDWFGAEIMPLFMSKTKKKSK